MHFLITAGGTREYIDPVRFISNASSGKMGYALAEAAVKAGHKVTLITAPTSLKIPAKAKTVQIETSKEMFDAVKIHFPKCDCLIMAAAVSDYKPARTSKTKIKKTCTDMTIKLKPTKDILSWAGKNKAGRIVVGFALEDKSIRQRAIEKFNKKNLDMIIANRPNAIAAEKVSLLIKTAKTDWIQWPNLTKKTAARKIIRLIKEFCKIENQP